MDSTSERPIWNTETGITDFEVDPLDLSSSEVPGIKAVWTEQQKQLKGTAQLSEFTDKLSREWAIETGVIENLYEIERGVTQTLIEHGFQAELLSHGSTNKPREYVVQLLKDQKDALDGVFDFVKSNRDLSESYVKELHAALLRSQDWTDGLDAQDRPVKVKLIKGAYKTQENFPVRDGVTYTYCPPEHVGSEMSRLVEMHAGHVRDGIPNDVRAAWLHHRFTQIHPFQDGNGRVARAIASLVLVKDGLFPLVVTRDDKLLYLQALETADGGDLKPLVDLFAKLQITQFRKASVISETLLAGEGVQAALGGLTKAADRITADRLAAFKGVFELSAAVETDIETRLRSIQSTIAETLQRVSDNGTAFIQRSKKDNDFWFRGQIFKNAKDYLGYFANTAEYRSWVALNMRWSRRAQLVFAIHGIGKPFNGSLICAPFLEFKDTDEDGQTTSNLIPLVEEGFVFFYNEDRKRLLSRFMPWREEVLKIALKELAQSL